MKTIELSRRQFLKGTGALIVSFNLFPPAIRPLRAGDSRSRKRSGPDVTRFLARHRAGRHRYGLQRQGGPWYGRRDRAGADRRRRARCPV